MAIAKERANDMYDIPDFKNIDFYVGVYKDVLSDGVWPKVGNIPFDNDGDAWTPQTFIEDILKPGNFEIYYKGKIRKATKDECLGLEVTAVWDREHVVDRLMGINTWTKICK